MNDYDSFAREMDEAEDLGSLPWWTPTQKTPVLIGEVLEYQERETSFGRLDGVAIKLLAPAPATESKNARPELAEAGECVMLWLKGTALINAWKKWAPAPGETVGVKRLGEKHGSRGTYFVYAVRVMGRNQEKPAFLSRPEPEPQPEPEPASVSQPWTSDDADPGMAGFDDDVDDLPF